MRATQTPRLPVSKQLLVALLIGACFLFPIMQRMVFTAEKTQTPQRPLADPASEILSQNHPARDQSSARTDPLLAENQVQVAETPKPNVEAQERPAPIKPVHEPGSDMSTSEQPKKSETPASVGNNPTKKKSAKRANNPAATAPMIQGPAEGKLNENKRVGSNSQDDLTVLDFFQAVRSQNIFAVQTPKTRYICCVPPKNGCTYHIGLLHRIVGIDDYERAPVVHDEGNKNDLNIERFSPEEIRDWFQDDSIPKYVVVRNPMMRTLSAYLDKVEPTLSAEEQTVEQFENWIMREFPKGRISASVGRKLKMNPHWMPQTEFCGMKSIIHTKFRVFRFEQPKEYVDYIYEFVPREFLDSGWRRQDNVSLKEFMLGPKKRTGGTSSKFPEYFRSLKIFDHLARELQADIEHFGYEEEVKSLRKTITNNQ